MAEEKNIAVSVIIAIYNAELYLQECLDSVCNQTLKDIEIICVDDGSTDRSAQMLQKYQNRDSRIKIIKQNNKGAGAARNAGLKIAQGKYLSFLDADDFFADTFLLKMYQKAESTSADIVVCSAKEFDHKTKQEITIEDALRTEYLPRDKDVFSYQDMPAYIFNSFQNWAWNKLFQTAFIKKNAIYFQEIQRTNDLLFTCTALVLASNITTVSETLVYYRINHGGNCQATNSKTPTDFIQAFKELKIKLYDLGIYKKVEKSYLNWALKSCIYNLLSIDDNNVERYLLDYLLHQGIEELGINNLTLLECYEKRDYFKLLLIKYDMWRILKKIRKIKYIG